MLQQIARHVFIVHSSYQSPSVNQGMERTSPVPAPRGDVAQERPGRPIRLPLHADHLGRRQHVHHLPVRSRLVKALPQVLRQQVGRCSREPDPPPEEDVAPELVAARRNLNVLEIHGRREDVLLEIIRNDPILLANDPVETPKLLRVGHLEEGEGQNGELLGFLLAAVGAGGVLQPLAEQQAGRSLVAGTDLTGEVALELRDQSLDITLPQSLVAVSQYGETDHHIWMGKL
mmetsp:Transcript_6398/g.18769  ORF Transcript_6398/g.18769 Transcript_6398/m.18769 type:complete len:231 (-) Transcript_6398:2954-3646(-)